MAKNKLDTWPFFLPLVTIHFLSQCFFFRSRPLVWEKKTLQSKKQVEFGHTLRCTLFYSVFLFRKANSSKNLLQILKLPTFFSTGQCSYVIIKLLWNHLAASFFFSRKTYKRTLWRQTEATSSKPVELYHPQPAILKSSFIIMARESLSFFILLRTMLATNVQAKYGVAVFKTSTTVDFVTYHAFSSRFDIIKQEVPL